MRKGDNTVKLPNPHRGDIGEGLLKAILEQAGVSAAEWLGEQPEEAETADKPRTSDATLMDVANPEWPLV